MTPQVAWLLGFLTIPAAILVAGISISLWRRITRAVLYAKPKHLTLRIRVAARIIDSRRAYCLGRDSRILLTLTVGRQWHHEEQARAVLLDEFLPQPAAGTGTAG